MSQGNLAGAPDGSNRQVTRASQRAELTCPRCSSHSVTRSHRRGSLEHLIAWIELYPYRCVACYNRFFRLGRS